MKKKPSKYASKQPLPNGLYDYGVEENAIWGELYNRQMAFLRGKACAEYFDGAAQLGLIADHVPQVRDISIRLNKISNFGVKGVAAIIPPSEFYALLADRRFPVATFLRTREDMDYIEEPDIFHEVFGHCPLLCNKSYSNFLEKIGKLAQSLGKGYSWHLFRLFWFTVEFGMIRTNDGLRGYGAGIVSSPSEAKFACSGDAVYADADVLTMLRTPYRIDIVQPKYFVIDSFEQLNAMLDQDIAAMIDRAKELGDLPTLFNSAA
ncbi:UNVERIFIED_CONTAM: hypothetical protein GTU68_026651 [Idotea baltica]|nr:hypothetical protein [Idotea baltica]